MYRISTPLFAAILTACLAACSGSGTPEEQVERARDFIATSDYSSAIIELKNALQEDGSYGEARLLLGSAYLDTGDPVSAEKELTRARKLGISDSEVSPLLAQALFLQQKASELFEVRTEGLPPEAQAGVLALKARAAIAIGENKKARRYLEDALALDEDSPDALLAQAEQLLNQGELARARLTLDLILDQDPQNATALALKGDVLLYELNLDEAKVVLGQALAVSPNLHKHRLRLGMLGIQTGDLALAEEQAKELNARAPKYPGGDYLRGLLHFQAGEYSEAIALLSAVEPSYQEFPLSLYFLGNAHLQEGNLDQAAVLAGRFHDLAPGSVDGRKLLAAINLQRGDFDKVVELLQPVIDADPEDIDAINMMANALVAGENMEQGLALLEQAAQLQPDSATAQVKLGAGLMMTGQDEAAASRLQTALELDPGTQQADILLILGHMRDGDQEAAIEAAEAYRARNPDSTTPLTVLGRIYMQAGREDEGRAAFDSALGIDPADIGANQALATMAAEAGDLATARKHYEAILGGKPNNLRAMIALALLEAQDNNEQGFVDALEKAGAAHPNAVEPRLLLGQYHLQQGRPDKVAPLLDTLEKPQRESVPALRLMATAQLAQRNYPETIHTMETLMAKAPATAQMHYLMAMAQAGMDDRETSTASLRDAVALDGEYLPARLALARMSLMQQDQESFQAELKVLKAQAPDNADVLTLLAADAALQGDTGGAVAFSSQAFEVAPSSATLASAAQYQIAAGDESAALDMAQAWLADNPDDLQTRLFVANQSLVSGEDEAAISEFQRILDADPDHIIALNNVAWLLREREPRQALTYIERARDLSPNSPEILDTLAVIQYANKDYTQANTSIREALLRKPDDPSLKYHRAMIAAALGNTAEAIKGLEAVLGSGADFPEQDDARRLLAQLQ